MISVNRKDDLMRLCSELDKPLQTITIELINRIVFLEIKLDALEQYPFIKVNPKNTTQQKITLAGKQYKELLQAYNNCLKIFLKIIENVGDNEESPLRAYINSLKEKVNE